MIGFIGVVAALTVLALSLIITRLATTALALTGLSREAARFQARSAFTGTGFTTSETEKVVDHPVRRRIIMLLMAARSAGLVTIIITLILSFGSGGGRSQLLRLLGLAVGVAILWVVSRSKQVDRYLERIIERALERWTDLDTRDYAGLLKLSGEYTVKEVRVREDDWLAGRKLKDCRLAQEGVTVLGIYRSDGTYVGAPKGETEIYDDNTLILYGRAKPLKELDKRRADFSGDQAHEQAVSEQEKYQKEQDRQEEEYRRKREERQTSGDRIG
jgi:hypothetical protein